MKNYKLNNSFIIDLLLKSECNMIILHHQIMDDYLFKCGCEKKGETFRYFAMWYTCRNYDMFKDIQYILANDETIDKTKIKSYISP